MSQSTDGPQAANPDVENGKSSMRGACKPAPRLTRDVDVLDPDAEEDGMFDPEMAKGEPRLNEVSRGIGRSRQRGYRRPKEVEGACSKRHHEPILGAEQAVDGSSCGTHLVRHATHRERHHSVRLRKSLRGIEESGGGPLVVFSRPTHSDTIS